MIANIKAGGVGISLHDINGVHPRVSLISPTQSATNLIQVLGRIHRSGGKTKSLQRIIFAANTPEDDISRMLFKKLANLSLLNDGDMESYYIDGLIEDKTVKLQQSTKSVEHDLEIIIDEQLHKIKKKNFIKTNRMSKLFPQLIDTISGVASIYLLKGRNIFEKKEIMLLGEYHDIVEPCKRCEKNCIEIIDLLTYVMYSVHPRKLDFYIESSYNPNAIDKFKDVGSFPIQSRITKLHNAYKYLLHGKYPVTENLRMHAVDIRLSYADNEGFYNDEYLSAYGNLYIFGFNDMTYSLSNAMTNMLKPNRKFKIDYDNNINFFKNYENSLRESYKFLSDDKNQSSIKKILKGDDNILDVFKISKQKDRFLENYGDDINDFAKELDKQMKNNFKNNDIVYDYLMYMKNELKSIDHIEDTKIYMKKFLNKVNDDKRMFAIYRDASHPFNLFMDTLSTYMDLYTIYRMLRKFDNKEQKNIIFYGGAFHSNNIYKILSKTGYFKLIVEKDINSGQKSHDCQVIHSVN
jgi:hypothetical protein